MRVFFSNRSHISTFPGWSWESFRGRGVGLETEGGEQSYPEPTAPGVGSISRWLSQGPSLAAGMRHEEAAALGGP